MSFNFKNINIVKELYDIEQIKYSTWIYDEEYNCYFDVVVTEKAITIAGHDIVDIHLHSKISRCGTYFGVYDENYDYNYWDYDHAWDAYGDGEILIFFSDCSGNECRLVFQQGRFNEAKNLFAVLNNLIERS